MTNFSLPNRAQRHWGLETIDQLGELLELVLDALETEADGNRIQIECLPEAGFRDDVLYLDRRIRWNCDVQLSEFIEQALQCCSSVGDALGTSTDDFSDLKVGIDVSGSSCR
jgi:hypothetical protein